MQILYPMFGMITLSGVIAACLVASRLPVVVKHWGNLQQAKHADTIRPHLPTRMRSITDNYNHVFEQPTLFYAVTVYLFLIQHTDTAHIILAWAYVGLRALHSVIQLTSNDVSWRATCFAVSTCCLIVMIAREVAFFI